MELEVKLSFVLGLKGSGKMELFSRLCHTYPERKLEDTLHRKMQRMEPEMRAELTKHFLTECREIVERARQLSVESSVDFDTVVQTLSSNIQEHEYITEDSYNVLQEAELEKMVGLVETEESSFKASLAFKNLLKKLVKDYPKWGGRKWRLKKSDRVNLSLFRAKGSVGTFAIESEGTRITFSLDNQASGAKRWFQVFDQVDAFVFVAAVDEYDLPGKRGSRLQDSIHEFFKRVNNENLLKIPMFLVLGRTTSFDEKFRKQKIPLNAMRRFPGAPTEVGCRGNDE